MAERRPTNSQLRLQRLTAHEASDEPRGILEVFEEAEQPSDEDAPLARATDDSD